jgi:acyl-CoA synthetase (AMP-forming)/AMP-acid ligase II
VSADGLPRRIAEAARPDRDAIVTGRGTLAGSDLVRAIDAVRGRLAAGGVGPGDRVLVLLDNSVELVAAVVAAMASGALAVPLAPGSGRRRLARVVERTTPALALAAPGAPPVDGVRTVALALEPGPRHIRFDPDPGAARPVGDPAPDDTALLLLSSGATGDPKCVALRHAGVAWTAAALARAFGLGADHVELVIGPLAHSGAWQRAAATLAAGGCLVLYEGPVTIAGILETCERHGVRGFYTPPPLVRYLLDTEPVRVRDALSACRTIEVGSAPLAADELARLGDLLPHVRPFVHYGLTECSRGTVLDARAHPDKLHTVGRPLPGAEVAITDDRGMPLPAGAPGSIRLRGPQLAAGYWGEPGLTGERFASGFVRTGDVGRLDPDGFLTFVGREDDRITTAGYSFFPLEAEEELGPVADVRAYLIAGVADPRGVLGQVPWAFVVPSRPEAWGPDAFLRAARERLPPYMVPRRVVAVPELPLTGTGKPDRREAVRRWGRPDEE